MSDPIIESDDDIHTWFGLTYANYLCLPRSILQSMPDEWQRRFVVCLEELRTAAWDVPQHYSYRVMAIDENGKFAKDPVPHYNRGRTRVLLRDFP